MITHKKFDKVSILPDIKVNIIFDANQKNRSDSDDSDIEVKYCYIILIKNKLAEKYYILEIT